MSRIVVSEFITLDGVIEDPGGSDGFDRGGWAFQFERGPEGDQFKLDEVLEAEALLLGRVTYEGFAQAWPDRTDEVGFAEDEQHAQVRGLGDVGRGRVERLDADQGRCGDRGREAQGGAG